MEINFNVGSLKIVYNPLMEYFKKIQGNVSQNLTLIRDDKKVATNYESIDLLVKAQGTLKMIGLLGIVKVLSLTTEALREVKEVKHDTAKSVAILEVVNHTIRNLVVYLENLLNGEQDQPTKFYEQYSQLANLLGKKVSIKDLFMVKLDLREEVRTELKEELRVGVFTNAINKNALVETMSKQHTNIQSNMTQMLKLLDSGFETLESKQQYQALCRGVYDSIQTIQNLKLSKNVYIVTGLQKLLICISSPIFNDEIVKVLRTDEKENIKFAVARIERVVAHWIKEVAELEDNDKTSSVKTDNDTVSDLLFLIIKALKNNSKLQDMPVLKDLNTYFNFDYYVNLLHSTEISYTLIQKNPELVKNIEQNLLSLKEELTLLTDKESLPEDFLVQHISKYILNLQKVNEGLNSANIKDLNNLFTALNTVTTKIKNKELAFNETIQKEISLSTLLIEYGVKLFTQAIVSEQVSQKVSSQINLESKRLLLAAEGKSEQLSHEDMPIVDNKNKENDANEALLSLYDQLSKELEKAEKILDTYLRTDGENAEELKDVYKPLSSAKGIFTVVKKPNLAKLVTELQNVWKAIEASGINSVDKNILQKSIVILSGLTLLVNAEKEGNSVEAETIESRLLNSLNVKVENTKVEVKKENLPEQNDIGKSETVVNSETEEKYQSNDMIVEPVVIVEELIVDTILAVPSEYTYENLTTSDTNSLFVDYANDEDMLEVYLLESEEVLENTKNSVEVLSLDLDNSKEVSNLRRYFHTLKGSGRMVGLNYLGEAAWVVEQTLSQVVSGNIVFDNALLDTVEQTRVLFVDWINTLKNTKQTPVDVLLVKNMFAPFNDNISTMLENNSNEQSAVEEQVNTPEEVITEVTETTEEIPFTLEGDTVAETSELVDTPVADNEEIKEENSLEGLVFETENLTPVEERVIVDTTEEIPFILEESNVEKNEVISQSVVEEEETNNSVLSVDSYKEEAPEYNNIQVEEEVIVAEDNTHIINGKEISEELFNMFIEESNTHIFGLQSLLNKENANIITNDFVIHAHTLSSISKAVNLNDFARLVHKIELLSTLAADKQVKLDKIQLRVLKNIVNKLDFYKSTVEGNILDEQLFNEDISLLDELQEDILAEKDAVNNVVEPIVAVSSGIDVNFKEAVEENFSEIKGSITQIQEEIKNLKEHGGSTVNAEELLETLMSKVKVQMDQQYENLNSLIKKSVHDNHEIVNELFSKVDTIEESVVKLDKQQKVSDKENRELLQSIHKDILGLGETLKKKSNGSYLEPFQEELIEESLSGDVIVNEQEGSLSKEVLDVLSNESFLDTNHEVKLTSKASLFILENEFIKTIFEDTVSNVEDEIDDDIYDISKEEADNMLEKIDFVMESVSPVFTISQNNELKRYLHTLKGSVRMAGANKIGALAHRLETILEYSENRNISLYDMQDVLFEEIDKIRFLLKDPKQNLTKTQLDWLDRKDLEVINTLSVAKSEIIIEEKQTVETKVEIVSPTLKREEKQYIKVNAELIDTLINEAGEIRLTRTTLEGMADNEKKSLNELKSSAYKLLKMLKEVEIQAESQIQAGKDKVNEENQPFDPLEFDRYTRLQELTRFMNEVVTDIQDTASELDNYNKIQNTTISNQTTLTNNVLDSLMKVRLVSFNTMSARLYKVTRETAKELGKKVSLELYGENTEFDRIVLDKVISPIDHLLRNSISHGIEMPNVRTIVGKESTGVIKIKTELEGNFIVIYIQDDGAGINVEKIKEIGLKKGLLSSEKEYTKEEIIDLIFHNGFSTAESVSKVAGRGVGMDIVRSEINALNGSIEIKTESGKGTWFKVVLPVALATNHAMLSENMGKLVAIPAMLVNEVISCKKTVLQQAYNEGFVSSRGKQFKIVYMGHLVGELPFNQRPEIKNYNSVILVNYLNEDLAVHVDKLHTTNEILIKKIGTHLSKVKGLLGVTLLGDGRQGIVVNPIMLENHYETSLKHKSSYTAKTVSVEKNFDTISVMVVDDSITVRRVTSKILEKNNFHVILAKDGEDALEQLQINTPDIILSDIEMPNMDGFELLKNLKNSDKYKNIPVIMITSRTADKHKNYAFELGVDGFLGKPYQEEELLEKMNELIKK